MGYNSNSARESLTRPEAFGDSLKNDVNFKLTSPETYQYNCIAYALGMLDRWVDHVDIPWHWWPPVERGASIRHLVEVFRYFGFEECGMDDKVDDIYDKIAIYDISDEWTHAARVVTDGIYQSKFGSSYDGLHSSGDVLKALYGSVCVIMRRLKTEAHLTDDRKGDAPGEIHLNFMIPINGIMNHIVSYKGKTYLAEHGREITIDKGKITLV